MVARHAPKLTPCYEEWVALDIDVSPFDNSGTKKEGVSWTYLKFDGFNPWFAYLGDEGYLVHCQLREGSEHCQEGMPQFLDEAIDYARRITQAKLLVRMDAGHDDLENLRRCQKHKVDWIIKRNLRQESLEDWLEEAQCHGECEEPREGKEVWTGETWKERDGKLYRVVFEVIQRTITADGQRLLVPEIEAATFWTSLKTARQAGDRALSPARHQRTVSFGDQVGHGLGAIAQWQVRHQRPGVVVGPGGLQRPAVVRADQPPAERSAAHGRSGCRSASRSPVVGCGA